MGGFGSLAFITAGLLRLGGDVRVPVASITALLLLAGKPAADGLAAWAAAVAGVHNRNGWITVDDSLPSFRAAPDLALPEGTVLIVARAGGSAGGGAYRGDGSTRGGEILSRQRGDHTAAIRGRITALDAFAMSAALLAAAPLIAAWVRGLVL